MEAAFEAASVLAGIVPNKLQNDYPTLMEWTTARRIASPRSAKSSEPEAEPPIASAAAA